MTLPSIQYQDNCMNSGHAKDQPSIFKTVGVDWKQSLKMASTLYIYRLAVPARDFPGFCCPGDFVILGILPSRGWSHPEEFAVPGFLQSWGFCHPRDFAFPGISHAFLRFPMPSRNSDFPRKAAGGEKHA